MGRADRPDAHRAKAIAAFYSSDFTVVSEFGHPLESLEKRKRRQKINGKRNREIHTYTGKPFSHEKEGSPAICNNFSET